MWTRAGLKERAKRALNTNYWRVILVTLIVFVIGGASTGMSVNIDSSEIAAAIEEGFMAGFGDEYFYEDDFYYEDDFFFQDEFPFEDDGYYEDDEFYNEFEGEGIEEVADFVFGIMLICALIIAIGALIIRLLLSVFIFFPLEVGTKRFFLKNLNQPAEVKEAAYAFDNSYKNVVKILFFRELYILGWSLLFVIPGIVKSYEYLMVPYLLAENPNLTKDQAFALSKQMMTGHKWDAFVLDLSFIGWDILSGATLGLLAFFYVQPYKCLTFAALYEELSLINGRPAFAQQNAGTAYQQVNPYWENAKPAENVQPAQTEEI